MFDLDLMIYFHASICTYTHVITDIQLINTICSKLIRIAQEV